MSDTARDRRPLAVLLAANVISVTGNMLTAVAVPWFVLQTTGSPARAGLVAFAATLPIVLAALLGGPLIDRLGQTVSSVVSDAVCAAAVGAIPVLHMAGALSYGSLLALVAVSGLFHAPGETAREVLMPRLAARAGTTVARASSGYESAQRGARMLGAPLAGLLISLTGAADALLVDAGTFAASALLIGLGVRGEPAPERPGTPVTGRGYLAELREGYAYLLGARLLLAVVVMVMVTNALDQAWSAVMLPVDAREHLGGATSIGLVTGTFAAAALTGSLLYGVFGHRLPQRGLFIGAFLACGFPKSAVAAFLPGLTPLIAVCAVSGVFAGVLNPIIGTEMVRLVPERLRSRVFGAVTSGVLVAVPLGGLLGGYVVQYAGLRTGMAAVSAVYLLTTLSPLVLPAFRSWDTPAAPAPRVAAPSST
ncbi:MFS transporter [Actinacidiphila bryophytorum]|uniref:Multidrug efflux pump Tap n=1 Tax=Actinacidiphila bryophytorum TaxID=1436133 RepID=A0A9W4E602_9ACTN|nr:MFS transporter [Actinacidiphila bryophytorum]MBM9434280.1 MFS transporter [Actinacidiphila bryophytorum]MBN6544785.1 MFS transporter [Actinacidiphila bryophytorum]CAG7624289.1 Major Facilitator Superfamily protein [Actinacidiphila bryophytorum]